MFRVNLLEKVYFQLIFIAFIIASVSESSLALLAYSCNSFENIFSCLIESLILHFRHSRA